MTKSIAYPYIPDGQTIHYVGADNFHMSLARVFAKWFSLDEVMPVAAIIVRDHVVLGRGTNGSDYHKNYKCQRKVLKYKTGEDYELCEGCHPKNHAEVKALEDSIRAGNSPSGADLYLWGH